MAWDSVDTGRNYPLYRETEQFARVFARQDYGTLKDGYYEILHQASRTDDLKCYPNNALIYLVAKLNMGNPEIEVVSYGLEPINVIAGLL